MNFYHVFGAKFIDGNYNNVKSLLNDGNLMVIPSGPGLASINKDLRYREALQNSDFAIPDSTYMIILLRLFKKIKLKKLSGYKFLKCFLFNEKFDHNELFMVDPTKKASITNNRFLNKIGVSIDLSNHYVAPQYPKSDISDNELLNKINNLKNEPKYIIINLGSGVQEPLGYFLKNKLKFKCSIICSGAAIAFLTGEQAKINSKVDEWGLGWLWRIFKNPIKFSSRYIKAFPLITLLIKEKVKRI